MNGYNAKSQKYVLLKFSQNGRIAFVMLINSQSFILFVIITLWDDSNNNPSGLSMIQ